MNLIFIVISLFFFPTFLSAMQKEQSVYPALSGGHSGLQDSGLVEHEQDFSVAVGPAAYDNKIPAEISQDWICKWLSKKNQALLATHDIADIRAACIALNSREDQACVSMRKYCISQNSGQDRQEESKAGDEGTAADLVRDADKIKHAYVKAILLELSAQEVKKCAERDEDMKPRKRKCCTGLALSAGAVAQLAWWGLYAAASSKRLGCWCLPWKLNPWDPNPYYPPYCGAHW